MEGSALLVSERTLRDLGFPQLRQALAARCRTGPGRARAAARPFLDSPAEVAAALAIVEEARRLAERQLAMQLGNVVDVRDSCERASKGGMLEARELVAISQVLIAFDRVREALEEHAQLAPGLEAISRRLPQLMPLATRIENSFEPSGELSDRASPALREARDRVRGLHATIKARLDRMLHDEKFVSRLRESYYSIRNDRYVVPVLAQHRNEVPGIVHNASQTGQTLFVEPEALIGLGNDLAIAQSLVVEEERRILLELSNRVGREAARIAEGVEAAAELDEAEAAAKLAGELRAHTPTIEPADGALELRNVRHPLLVLAGGEVVPNDIILSGERRALVVSGPNAGGKTVTLTTVGLCAVMLRMGLPVPAAEGSRLPLYRSVHASIGDAQDLSQGLSTFSAHIAELRDIDAAVQRGSLALIDEIAADTDPREGAAIAIAVLEDLIERGATVVVTTHLEEVKALAHMDPRFLNARVGFDAGTMTPTYRLQLGFAGASSAIELAARMGLPQRITDRARDLALHAGGPLARALAAAEEERKRLAEELTRAQRAAEAAEAEKRALAAEREAERRRREEGELRFREELAAELELAAHEARQAVAQIKAQAKVQDAARLERELQAKVDEAKKRVAEAKAKLQPEAAPKVAGDLRVGGLARHVGLNQRVEVLEISDGTALVAAGLIKMRAPLSDLVPIGGEKPKVRFASEKSESLKRAEAVAAAPVQTPGQRLDLRGMRADEALAVVEQFMDRAFGAGEDSVTLLHGHGTGALKQTVRQYLDRSAYVRMYRPGSDEEGGDAVTIVAFRT
ncbi:MAG: Smr/MutS family protein [Myxococcaceae bacterium]|nr:Smr/MutS family protein [Myxococcaceae bacterium]